MNALSSPLPPNASADCERDVTSGSTTRGNATADATWQEGRAATLEEVVAYALAGPTE